MSKRVAGKCFPPYIDSYLESKYDFDQHKEIGWTKKEFEEKLKSIASEYGTASIGELVFRQKEAQCYGRYDDYRWILAIGWHGNKRYAMIGENPHDWDKFEMVEFNWSDDWDVT